MSWLNGDNDNKPSLNTNKIEPQGCVGVLLFFIALPTIAAISIKYFIF